MDFRIRRFATAVHVISVGTFLLAVEIQQASELAAGPQIFVNDRLVVPDLEKRLKLVENNQLFITSDKLFLRVGDLALREGVEAGGEMVAGGKRAWVSEVAGYVRGWYASFRERVVTATVAARMAMEPAGEKVVVSREVREAAGDTALIYGADVAVAAGARARLAPRAEAEVPLREEVAVPVREIAAAADEDDALPEDPGMAPAAAEGAPPLSAAAADIAAPSFSLAEVAKDREFLNEAWVSFDEGKKVWQATWPKPPMFHYGMVLLPALAARMEAGQSVQFEFQGKPATISKREDGQLMVARAGHARLINAQDIKGLLERQIQTDGMILFLDGQGNLVLQATGDQAYAMARIAEAAN